MRGSRTAARNEIEARHLDAIARFGHESGEFTFDTQLARLRRLSTPWTDESERAMRKLDNWSPSRFELIELLPLYHGAAQAIRTMQAMSWDRWDVPDLEFVVASKPSPLAVASIDDNAEDVGGSLSYVVWMHVGLMNFVKAVANHCVWTLVRPRGSLEALFDDIAGADRPDLRSLVRDLLARPFDHEAHLYADPLAYAQRDAISPEGSRSAPPMRLEPFHSSDAEAHRALAFFLHGFTTFVAGHEIAHVYLGHIGSQPRIHMLEGNHGLQPGLAREVEADVVGLGAIWDGMRAEAGMSIDYTWLGPVAFLSSMAGVHLIGRNLDDPLLEEAAIEPAVTWTTRLQWMVHALLDMLRGNDFEVERIRRVGTAIPPVAAAITEWLRINALPDGQPSYQLYGDLEAELREICDRALARR
jgi:hypothetical protein